jgi:hypothetical protein
MCISSQWALVGGERGRALKVTHSWLSSTVVKSLTMEIGMPTLRCMSRSCRYEAQSSTAT